jgi:hypothetical protein
MINWYTNLNLKLPKTFVSIVLGVLTTTHNCYCWGIAFDFILKEWKTK